MEKLTHKESMWITTLDGAIIGIVKAWDPAEEQWKFFFGAGKGHDIDEDVQRIIELGQKTYSLDYITAFGDLTPPKEA